MECKQLEENNKCGNSIEVFATIRNLNGEFRAKLGVLKDESGKIVTEEKEVQERWKQYTKQLYSRDPSMTEPCDIPFTASEPEILKSKVE